MPWTWLPPDYSRCSLYYDCGRSDCCFSVALLRTTITGRNRNTHVTGHVPVHRTMTATPTPRIPTIPIGVFYPPGWPARLYLPVLGVGIGIRSRLVFCTRPCRVCIVAATDILPRRTRIDPRRTYSSIFARAIGILRHSSTTGAGPAGTADWNWKRPRTPTSDVSAHSDL